MSMMLLLPWFPIILAVGVGARLLGRERGLGLGFLCALFWIVLAQSGVGFRMWSEPWTVMTLIAGAVAIIAMGAWAGQRSPDEERGQSGTSPDAAHDVSHDHASEQARRLTETIDMFNEWLDTARDADQPWAEFGEFLRSALHRTCTASHVRLFRLSGDHRQLLPLHETETTTAGDRLSATEGVYGRVLATGRAFVAGAGAVRGTAAWSNGGEAPMGWSVAWCFPVMIGSRTVGMVTAGRLEIEPRGSADWLLAVERMTSHFWRLLDESLLCRSAARTEPVSGLFTRPAFLRMAERSLRESRQLNEPSATAVIALEGLRDINDSGRWETADELIAELASALRRKLRSDDRLGWFDGSRFVVFLRRVDAGLATLILEQMLAQVELICGDRARWRSNLRVRCGATCGDAADADLRLLISRSLLVTRRARETNVKLIVDGPGGAEMLVSEQPAAPAAAT